jgi:hypothetical protein
MDDYKTEDENDEYSGSKGNSSGNDEDTGSEPNKLDTKLGAYCQIPKIAWISPGWESAPRGAKKSQPSFLIGESGFYAFVWASRRF